MKALVTGGAGFIGSHVADSLLGKGLEVTILDDLSGGFVENIPGQACFIEGSITDAALVERMFKENRFDYVFHLAAYAAEGLSHFIRDFNYRNNLLGTVNLVRHDIKCFVFTSSIAVYGAGQAPMSEDMAPEPEDPYGIAKYAVELDLRAACRQFGLNYIIFRPHNVYGERQNIGDKYRNVVGIFMNRILRGEPLAVFGDGSQTRAFSYISDVAPVIAGAVFNKAAYGQVFNIGGSIPATVAELAEMVMSVMGARVPVRNLRARNEVAHAYCSHAKIADFFNLPEETSLEDGLRRMSAWVKRHGARTSGDFANIEIAKGLPDGW